VASLVEEMTRLFREEEAALAAHDAYVEKEGRDDAMGNVEIEDEDADEIDDEDDDYDDEEEIEEEEEEEEEEED
jgi:hypothetical protein